MNWLLLPLGLQAAVMAVDEFYFHRRRGLGTWERRGHPIDTIVFAACAALALASIGHVDQFLVPFIVLAAVSCVVVTKDEFVHKDACGATETWLHSLLFILHPICLYSIWSFAVAGDRTMSTLIFTGIVVFFFYQLIYWNFIYDSEPTRARE